MTSSPSPSGAGRDGLHRYGVLLLGHGETMNLHACLESIRTYTVAPARVVIVDRGTERAPGLGDSTSLAIPIRYWWTGDDLGVGGSIEVGLRYLSDCEAVVLLDDATVLGREAAELMLAGLLDRMGAVVGHGADIEEVEDDHRFAWFPSVLRLDVVNAVGAPLAGLFSWYDDWEYGLRMTRHGYSIGGCLIDAVRDVRQHDPASDTYLRARNTLYLLAHRRLWNAALFGECARFARMAMKGSTHPESALARRGLNDGLRSRLGPPPPDVASYGSAQVVPASKDAG